MPDSAPPGPASIGEPSITYRGAVFLENDDVPRVRRADRAQQLFGRGVHRRAAAQRRGTERARHGREAGSGHDRHDAAADTAFGRQADLVAPLAGEVVDREVPAGLAAQTVEETILSTESERGFPHLIKL